MSDVAHACAEGYYAAPLVPVMRADALRTCTSMGQCEVQIQADGGRAEPIHWESCLIPLMAWVRTRLFPLQDAAVVASFLLIDGLVG